MDLDPQSGKLLDPEPDSNECVSTVLNYLNADPDPGGNLNTDPYGSGSSKKVRLRIRLRIRLHNTGSDTYAFICTYIQPGAPPPPCARACPWY